MKPWTWAEWVHSVTSAFILLPHHLTLAMEWILVFPHHAHCMGHFLGQYIDVYFHESHCSGQPFVWHMFFGKGLWWVMPTIKIYWFGLYPEIGQIHLSIEAQCVTPVYLWVAVTVISVTIDCINMNFPPLNGTGRIPFWLISVPQRVGFSSNVPLSVGGLDQQMCAREGIVFPAVVPQRHTWSRP